MDARGHVSHWISSICDFKRFTNYADGILLAFSGCRVDLYIFRCLRDGAFVVKGMYNTLTSRVIGFVASLVLTFTAFLLVVRPYLFHLEIDVVVMIILILAVLQGMAQAIFFLHVLSERGTRWNLFVFASTISIIVVIVVFSIWIMNHLNYNMMHH